MNCRELLDADGPVLEEATLLNLNWFESRFSPEDIHQNSAFRHYTELVPERGDFGILLEDEAGWVAVCWLLFLDMDDPGFGYIRDGIPELSICVSPAHRGRGFGREILDHTIAKAQRREIEAIALSVEEGNPARHLYDSAGFKAAPEASNLGTMILTL